MVHSLFFQNCDSQEFRVVTSRSGYPKKRTLRLTEDFCLIVFKLRNICADNYRKKAFEDYYKGETLPGAVAISCSIVTGFFFNSLGPCVWSLPWRCHILFDCWSWCWCWCVENKFVTLKILWQLGASFFGLLLVRQLFQNVLTLASVDVPCTIL